MINTVFILVIGQLKSLLYLFILTFEQPHFTICSCVQTSLMSGKQCRPRSDVPGASDLGLYCLPWPVYPNAK